MVRGAVERSWNGVVYEVGAKSECNGLGTHLLPLCTDLWDGDSSHQTVAKNQSLSLDTWDKAENLSEGVLGQ